MAKHMLDGGTTKCSCKGGGCKICGASNRLISLHNDLMKFGLSKETLKEKVTEANKYLDKIDSYTLYEYLSGEIDEEKFNEALENFKPTKRKPIEKRKSEVEGFKPTTNPERYCVFDSDSPWARCKKCNSIRKYIQGKVCPMYVESLGTTDTENK